MNQQFQNWVFDYDDSGETMHCKEPYYVTGNDAQYHLKVTGHVDDAYNGCYRAVQYNEGFPVYRKKRNNDWYYYYAGQT